MRPHRLLAMWAVLVLLVGITVVASDRLDLGGGGADQIIGGPDGAVTTTTAPLTDADGTRQSPAYVVAVAAYDLTITPDGSGGWTIEGLVDSGEPP